MKRRLFVSPRADQDIDEQFAYIAQDDLATAVRFLEAASQTFDDLLALPFKGTVRHFTRAELADLRLWFVQGFEKHLIFYRVTSEAVIIVRVLHSSRNLERVLKEE
jgi:toxin ParE1/3/4